MRLRWLIAAVAPVGLLILVLLWPRGSYEATTTELARSGPSTRDSVMAPTVARELVASKPSSAGTPRAAQALTIRILDAMTKAPVRGADVWFLSDPSPTDLDPEQLARDKGEHLVADAGGEVRVASPARHGLAVARSGELYGQRSLLAGREDAVVELSPDANVTVKVLDSSGSSAQGVRVLLYEDPPSSARPWPRLDGISDAAGLVGFRHVPARLRQDDRNGGFVPARLLPKAHLVGKFVTGEPFVFSPPPHRPVLLTLPPAGRVVVRLPESRPARVSLLAENAKQDPEMVEAKDGVGTFEQVPLGLALSAGAWLTGGGDDCEPRVFTGPRVLGEQVEVALAKRPAKPRLVGRALGEDGKALAQRPLSVLTRFGDRGVDVTGGSTDGGGRFSFEVERGALGRLVRAFSVTLYGKVGGPAELLASEERSFMVVAPETNLGDIVLSLPPLVCAVDVVDGSGAAVTGARAKLVVREGDRMRDLTTLELEQVIRSPAPGRYEVRGRLTGQHPLLSIVHDGYVAIDPLDFAIGQDDIRVVLERGIQCTADALVDPGFGMLTAALRDPAMPGREWRPIASPVPPIAGKSSFRWPPLPAGQYEVVIGSLGDPDPLATLAGVSLCANDAPRPWVVDLRGRLRTFGITVEGGRTELGPMGSGVVRVPAQNGGRTGQVPLMQGKASVVTTRASLRVIVFVPGCKKQELTLAEPETRITMTPGYHVRVACEGLPDPAIAGLCAALVRPDFEIGRNWQREMWVMADQGTLGERTDGAAEFTFVVPEPGAWRLILGQRRADALDVWPEHARPLVTIANSTDEQTLRARTR